MARAMKVCSTPGCATLVHTGRCDDCKRAAELKRGTATQRGYSRGHTGFRRAVLARDPLCTYGNCYLPSTDADHHPRDKRTLIRLGLNSNNPAYGRGLCSGHHKRSTAQLQPGGWNAAH